MGYAAIAALGCLLILRLFRWYRFLNEFRLAQISPEELYEKLKMRDRILLLDLQGGKMLPRKAVAIPGSIRMDPSRLKRYIEEYRGVNLGSDREVILYGASSQDSTGARVALALRRIGFEKVRPLSGGLPAWVDRGYPVIRNPPALLGADHDVFALQEILRHSRMHVAQLLNRSATEIDQVLKRVKARIQLSHDDDLRLLKKSDIERPVEVAEDLLSNPQLGETNAPE